MSAIEQANLPFGEADLSNCEREQIHLAGCIQPHGLLLVVTESALTLVQASANAPALLGLDTAPLGRPLAAISADLAERVRLHVGDRLDRLPVVFRCGIGSPARDFDGLLHRPAPGLLVLELEPCQALPASVTGIDASLQQLLAAGSLRRLCDETARVVKQLSGFDRVMVYRFDEAGHGQVYAEQREAHLEPLLDNWYPASDIPQMARRLYQRNRIRLLVDVAHEPVPLEPRRCPATGAELDMSLCVLRSPSPIHTQYLKNMGVAATLVISLMAGGRLWGLIACHHGTPRFVSYPLRAQCELLGEVVAMRIAALESFAQARAEALVRRLEQRLIDAVSRDGDWKAALFDHPQALLQPLAATGAALLLDDRVWSSGEVPSSDDLRGIGRWLDAQPRAPVLAQTCLGGKAPRFAHLRGLAAGLLAVPLSARPGDYLIWLRPERVRTLTWGGNPHKPVEASDDPSQLSPRRSFAKWHQLVEGTAEPWTAADRTLARLIGESVADVMQQFRAVRLLLVQDQLEQARRQVQASEQATAIADREGRLLAMNDAFARLIERLARRPRTLEQLAGHLHPVADARLRLLDLQTALRPWRAEVELDIAPGERRPFLLRADAVQAAAGQALGYVLLLTDISQRQQVDAARRRFQADALAPPRSMAVPLESEADLLYRNLFAELVRSAQVAALEVADGAEVERVPEMLDGIRSSLSRTAELLEHLLWYERGSGDRQH